MFEDKRTYACPPVEEKVTKRPYFVRLKLLAREEMS